MLKDYYEIYLAVERMRIGIKTFNLMYKKCQEEAESELTPIIIQLCELCETGCRRAVGLKSGEQYFEAIQCGIHAVGEAAKEMDITTVYDILNARVLPGVIRLLVQVFQQYGDEIGEQFWENNRMALGVRYPEVAEKIERLPQKEGIDVRPYGLRGRVIYSKKDDLEFDLYSAYDPFETGETMTGMFLTKQYDRIYVWGCNGGYEIDGLAHNLFDDVVVEVYIEDLWEFMCILKNTARNGVILQSNIHWHFEVGVQDFLQHVSAGTGKEKKYLYVSRFCDKDIELIAEFVINHWVDSNIGGTYGGKHIKNC